MKNLFKYAASYWKAMIAIVLILVVQAYCDLSLPAYTSDIVNVGIQQGGIEDEVPRQIAIEEMEKLLLFVSEDDQQTVMDAYTEDNTSYKKEAYVLKDSVAEEENTMENLKDILQIPMMMTSGIESGSDTTKQMEDKLKEQMSQGMAQSMPQGADRTMPEGILRDTSGRPVLTVLLYVPYLCILLILYIRKQIVSHRLPLSSVPASCKYPFLCVYIHLPEVLHQR